MLPRSRVTGSLDINRFSKALARPGIDTRLWASYAIVTAIKVESNGVFCDVVLMPSERLETARLPGPYSGTGFGAHFPVQVDDEVLIVFPQGRPDEGGVIVSRMWSASDNVPPQAVSEPNDVVVHVKPGQKITIIVEDGGTVELGSANLGSTDGVVHGSATDPFTGLSYTFLGNTSEIVKAQK